MTDPISNELARFMADEIGHGMIEKVQRFADLAVEFYSCRQSPAGVEPVAWGESFDGGKTFSTVSLIKTRHHNCPLYASPTKAIKITDEMRQAIRVLKLIADGYSAKGDGLGEFVQVENPDYRPDNGSDPYIVVDIAALETQEGGE